MQRTGPVLVALLGVACAPVLPSGSEGIPVGASPPGAVVPSPRPSIYTITPPSPAPPAYAEALAKPSLPALRAWSGSQVDGDPPEGELVARTQEEWQSGVARFPGLAAADADEEPDFIDEMRLALVRTWSNYRARIEIVTIEEQADRLVVHSVLADDSGMFVSPMVSHPFDIVDCPKRTKPVVFAEPMRIHWVHLPEGRIRPVAR